MIEEVEERRLRVDKAKSGRIAEEVARMIGRVDVLLAVLRLQVADNSWLADGDKERFRRNMEGLKTDLEWVRKQHDVKEGEVER